MTISGSVGRGGKNVRKDVETVQKLLNRNQYRMKSAPCLLVNGNANNDTIRAIETFQREVLRFRQPDGRVDPNNKTISGLLEKRPGTGPSINTTNESVGMIETGVLVQNHALKFGESVKSQYPSFPAVVLDSATLAKLLKDFGFTGAFHTVKSANGRQYVVFKGYAGLRSIFRGTKYVASNPKILEMAIGKLGLTANVKASGFLTVFTYAFIEAPRLLFEYRDKTLGALGVRFGSDMTKVALSTLASLVAGKLALAATSVVCAPLAAAIVVGFTVGLGLEYIDRKLKLTQRLEEYVTLMQDKFEREAARQYGEFERGFMQWICHTQGICLPRF